MNLIAAINETACQTKNKNTMSTAYSSSCPSSSSSESKTLTFKSGGSNHGHNDDEVETSESSSSNPSPQLPCLRPEDVTVGNSLGTGGFCKVFAVRRLAPTSGIISSNGKRKSPNKMAIKILDTEQLFSKHENGHQVAVACARDLKKEGELLYSLSGHQNVVSIYGWSSHPCAAPVPKENADQHDMSSSSSSSPFLLLERLDGTLKQKLTLWRKNMVYFQSSSKAIIAPRCNIVLELADALQHIHKCGIIHRDLKPANIGFRKGALKLFDFGVGRQVPNHNEKEDSDDELYNMTGIVGTRRYMSPECGRCEPYNCKTDVYSFGLLCYEILSLQKPYSHIKDPKMVTERVCHHGERPNLLLENKITNGSSFKWPVALLQTMEQLWHEDIRMRPSMKESTELLSESLPLFWKKATAPNKEKIEKKNENNNNKTSKSKALLVSSWSPRKWYSSKHNHPTNKTVPQ